MLCCVVLCCVIYCCCGCRYCCSCCYCCSTNYNSGERPPKRAKLPTEERDLQDQLPLNVKGQYVTVTQKRVAGFSSGESLLFARQETVDLWNALDSPTANLVVDGPPGTGKSTEVWAWALWKAVKDKLKVTWYHMTNRAVEKVLIDGTTNKITFGYTAEITDIVHSEGSILIVDGVISSINFAVSRDCHNWCKSQQDRRFIMVSSVSVSVALQENREAAIVQFTVGSWTFEQYQEACADDDFFGQVKVNLRCPGQETVDDRDQLLLAKYYFAGGCARWMFEFNHHDCIMDFDAHLEKVGDYHSLWGSGGGDQTIVAVNHLRGVTMVENGHIKTKKYFFISQHVAAVLAANCSDMIKFLTDSYKMAAETKNPAFEGWVFEFDVDYQLTQACKKKKKFNAKMRSSLTDGATDLLLDERSVDVYIVFNSVEDLIVQIQLLGAKQILWAKPKCWCQKAYDFLCLWKDDSDELQMVVANATLAKTHSVLLSEVKTLARALGQQECAVSAIRLDFIVPENANFSIGDIVGRLCEWKNLRGKQWPNSPSLREYPDYLAVTEVLRTS